MKDKILITTIISLLFICSHDVHAEDKQSLIVGQAIFEKWCAICHGNSVTKPATAIISIRTGSIESAALANRTDLHPLVIKNYVRNGINWMPGFRKTEISDIELKALIDYLTRRKRQ